MKNLVKLLLESLSREASKNLEVFGAKRLRKASSIRSGGKEIRLEKVSSFFP